jgi:hypothetical protein
MAWYALNRNEEPSTRMRLCPDFIPFHADARDRVGIQQRDRIRATIMILFT